MARPRRAILETMRLDAGRFERVERHVTRMASAADYFGFEWCPAAVHRALDECRADHAPGTWRVRLMSGPDGACRAEAAPHADEPRRAWRVALAASPVDADDPFLFHKTTNRGVYDRHRAARPDVDDVILWNARGEITESTIANIVLRLDGALVTPPRSCGLLAGTFREELLESAEIVERVVTIDDLARASEVFLVNSLRGWIRARLVVSGV